MFPFVVDVEPFDKSAFYGSYSIGEYALILEKEKKLPQFYSEAKTEQKTCNFMIKAQQFLLRG